MMTENSPQYSIDEDSANSFVRANIAGYWNMSAVEGFEQSMHAATSRVERQNGGAGIRLLIDARDSVAQSKEVVERLQNLARQVTLNISRTAVLVSGALVKMQAQRINVHDHAVFDNEQEAMDWLMSPDQPTPD